MVMAFDEVIGRRRRCCICADCNDGQEEYEHGAFLKFHFSGVASVEVFGNLKYLGREVKFCTSCLLYI
jgi:hypothetical protein